jgi:UDP-N-acetylglucosamine transferase subunit ALG13
MIVVTVGTQLPFDRLIAMIDELAPRLSTPVFAQTGSGQYKPQNIRWSASMRPSEFEEMLRDASVIVAHAGIGTVLKAYKYGKPIILVPRQAAFGEHRNDHQLATVAKLAERRGIYVARSKEELTRLLDTSLVPATAEESAVGGRKRLIDFLNRQAREAVGGMSS